MSNEQILKKAIEKANIIGHLANFEWLLENKCYRQIIFSHDFAKEFWGKKFDYFNKYNKEGVLLGELLWQYHLQQMVLEKEPLKYLEKFL